MNSSPVTDLDGADGDGLVWHYTDGNGLISILGGHCLWATSAAFLNDAQEVALGVARLVDRLGELALQDDLYQRMVDGIDPRRQGGMSPAMFFILSASTSPDSLAMWRLYGGVQESYAVGLDASAPLSVLSDGLRLDDEALVRSGTYLKRKRWEPVRYGAAEQEALVDAVFDDLPLQLADVADRLRAASSSAGGDREPSMLPESTWTALRAVLDDLEHAVLLAKHEGFVDEREVRQSVIVHTRGDDPATAARGASLFRHRATRYGIAPYVRLTGGDPDHPVVDAPRPLPVRAVAISPSPNGPAAEASVRHLLHSNGYPDARVLRSRILFRA